MVKIFSSHTSTLWERAKWRIGKAFLGSFQVFPSGGNKPHVWWLKRYRLLFLSESTRNDVISVHSWIQEMMHDVICYWHAAIICSSVHKWKRLNVILMTHTKKKPRLISKHILPIYHTVTMSSRINPKRWRWGCYVAVGSHHYNTMINSQRN